MFYGGAFKHFIKKRRKKGRKEGEERFNPNNTVYLRSTLKTGRKE